MSLGTLAFQLVQKLTKKVNYFTDNIRDMAQYSLTGSTSETLLTSILIPANTFTTGDILEVTSMPCVTTAANNKTLRFYFNTSSSLAGATQYGAIVGASTITFFRRHSRVISTGLKTYFSLSSTIGNSEGATSNTTVYTSINVDFTVDQYLVVSGQLTVGTDTLYVDFITIKKR